LCLICKTDFQLTNKLMLEEADLGDCFADYIVYEGTQDRPTTS
jgi:hypothetical protein